MHVSHHQAAFHALHNALAAGPVGTDDGSMSDQIVADMLGRVSLTLADPPLTTLEHPARHLLM